MSPRDAHAGKLAPQGCGFRRRFLVVEPAGARLAPLVPSPAQPTPADWQRLRNVAAAIPGSIGPIPAGKWWPAFLLTLLDTGADANDLLAVRQVEFDSATGELECGSLCYRLHQAAVAAVSELLDSGEVHLFPWPFDADQTAGRQFRNHLDRLLSRAGLSLSSESGSLEKRLLRAASRCAGLLDELALESPTSQHVVLGDDRDFGSEIDPTPEEIAAACAEIRAGWSNCERRLRAGWAFSAGPWTPPVSRSAIGG